MTLVPLTRCCRLLGIDAKTLRQWLKQSQLAVHSHPTDARIRGLTMEAVQQLASVHERPITLDAPTALLPELHQQHAHGLTSQTDPELIGKLASLEATVATLQQQVTQLALELLQERERVSAGRCCPHATQPASVWLTRAPNPSYSSLQVGYTKQPRVASHPGELRARSRILPLIEYGANATYVIIDPVQGELHFLPDSPEWFDRLASLSSFRFVGKLGRFTAHRKGSRLRPSRGWSARRCFHQRHHYYYLGITDHLTIDRLEQVAAKLQSHIASL